jgi:hypothetical protein
VRKLILLSKAALILSLFKSMATPCFNGTITTQEGMLHHLPLQIMCAAAAIT